MIKKSKRAYTKIIFPILNWQRCFKCGEDWKWNFGWRVYDSANYCRSQSQSPASNISDNYFSRAYCIKCAPTKACATRLNAKQEAYLVEDKTGVKEQILKEKSNYERIKR